MQNAQRKLHKKKSMGHSRSQDFAKGGGGFFGSLMQLSMNLTQVFISLELDWGGFSVKIRWSPNKGLHRLWVSSRTKNLRNSGPNNGKSFTTSATKSRWGVAFIFGAKLGLKSSKNVLFCILFRPPPPPRLRYCYGGGAIQRLIYLISTSFGLDLWATWGFKGLSYSILFNAFQIVSI